MKTIQICDIDDWEYRTDAFLNLSGTWGGNETAKELIEDIYLMRMNRSRFEKSDDLFGGNRFSQI